MGEHDDDLESEVQEGAEVEQESFPVTGDDLDTETTATPQPEDEPPGGDEDPSEL